MEPPDIVKTYETDGAILQVGRSAQAEPINPINLNDPIQAFTTILREHSAKMEHCMPGIVTSFNRVTHVARVMPLLKMKTNTGDSTQRLPIDVHVWRFASGGKIIDLPVKAGDTGWLIGGDFDTGLAQSKNAQYDPEENAGPQTPTTGDIHKFTFGFFLPDNFCSFPDIARFGDDIVIGEYDKDGNITNSGVGGSGIKMFEYDKSAQVIRKGYIMTPRNVVEVPEFDITTLESFPSRLYIVVSHPTSSSILSASIGTANQNTDVQTVIPLYDFNTQKDVVYDYRAMPLVPIYES